ncbi:DUF3505 multi-domain protein [Pyrenophora tritici-repentis]|nr:DUF3505 multi-domain protein [Pyrenophora tritici-repentis]
MAESTVGGQHFAHLVEYALAVCRECQHGVLPSHIKSHVQRAHPAKRKQAKAIAEEVGNWAGLIQYAGELEVPSQVIKPIHQLPVYKDGLMCQVDPNHCRRIFRKPEGIRKHWRDVHSWSAAGKGGHPTREKQKEIQERISQHCKKVHCQRLLVQGQGSQYFQVHEPDENNPNVVPVNSEAAWAQVGEQMARAWETIEKRAQTTIQEGERDEVNPWLERTQWLPYLVGIERPDLLACIEEPVAEPDARQEQQAEPVEAAIWAAMDGLARFSQASVIDRIGVFVRLEAIRTEMHQTRFQPLQPYMDKDAVVKHGEGPRPKKLSKIQKACLEFCIALLNNRITRREYDSPLVCALAVLGVKEDGWKGPEQYPPILSAVIKIARFMVVQKGLEMSGPEEDSGDETDDDLDDSAYESGPSQRRRPKGCLQLVQKIIDRFMVRGSHSPMQWMLDLRTYGLKIHYNTTTRGHVEWTNGDELLYKELHFSMAQFRGMVHRLASESRRLLTEELMFSSKAAPVPAVL